MGLVTRNSRSDFGAIDLNSDPVSGLVELGLVLHSLYRAGFSWWETWGPAIGVGDGGKGLPSHLPHPKKIPKKILFGKT